jgi:hypothetical protein
MALYLPMDITEARSGDEMPSYSGAMDAPADGPVLPPHTPGAGKALLRQLWGPDRVRETSPEVKRQIDDLIAQAQRSTAERRGSAAA